MAVFSLRPLALLLCCLPVGTRVLASEAGEPVVRSEPVLLAAAEDAPLRLRSERRFNVLGKKKKTARSRVGIEHPVDLNKDDVYPMFIVADRMDGRSEELTDAEGNVELRKAGTLVYADRLQYRPLEDRVDAQGNVRLLQEGAEVNTPHLHFRIAEQTGFAESADYHMVQEVRSRLYRPQQLVMTYSGTNALNTSGAPMMSNVPNNYGLPTVAPPTRPSEASGHAERIEFQGENRFLLSNSTFSTCKPGATDWYLQAEEVRLDFDEDKGEANAATVYFKDTPIFYLPEASFALNHQRRSGFLHPYYSASTKNGFDLTLPYYWNIAPNYDATLFPRYMAKRGFQLGAEAQLFGHYHRGTVRAEFMPQDEVLDRQRYAFNIQHTHHLGNNMSGVINWQRVSDNMYWQDMSSRLLNTSLVQLPQQLVFNYSPASWLHTSTQFLRYQTLQIDPNSTIARPYFVEPQINVFGFKANVLKTDLSVFGQYSRFSHPDKTNGERMVFYPQVSLPIIHPSFQIVPKVGVHLTSYALSQQSQEDRLLGQKTSLTRGLPTFSLDSTVVFERDSQWLGKDYIQTLEPRLYYVRIPYRDQSLFPNFDSGLTDFNFAQIFAENRYSGQDRINDANQLTAAVTTRFLGADTGAEYFKGMIGQRYYFQPQRVMLNGETQRKADFSNIVVAANGLVADRTYVDLAWEYNHRESSSDRFSAGMRYQPDYGRVLSASYRYIRDPLSGQSMVKQVDLAGQWPISGRWYAVGRYNYSLRDSQLLEAIGGIEYNEGCWSTRLVVQRLEALAGSANTTVFLQLELKDFASIGSNPIGLLHRSIPGFGKVNELPAKSNLLNNY